MRIYEPRMAAKVIIGQYSYFCDETDLRKSDVDSDFNS